LSKLITLTRGALIKNALIIVFLLDIEYFTFNYLLSFMMENLRAIALLWIFVWWLVGAMVWASKDRGVEWLIMGVLFLFVWWIVVLLMWDTERMRKKKFLQEQKWKLELEK